MYFLIHGALYSIKIVIDINNVINIANHDIDATLLVKSDIQTDADLRDAILGRADLSDAYLTVEILEDAIVSSEPDGGNISTAAS